LTVALALSALLVFSAARAGAQTNITLGPTTLTDGTYDTSNSNQATEQGSFTLSGNPVNYSFTNNTGTSLAFTASNFSWFSSQNPQSGAVNGVISPYVVLVQNSNLQATNSQQVLVYGDAQTNFASGLQTAPFWSGGSGGASVGQGSGNTFDVLPGQTIGIGFLDAYPDGTAGAGPSLPFVTAPAGAAWYYGNATLGTYTYPPSTPANPNGGALIGGASTSSVTDRAYQFNVSFSYVGTDQGAWTGLSSTLDNTSQNFALNPPGAALSKGSLTDVQNDLNIPGIIFGDAYFVNGGSVAVSHSDLTVAANGIAPTLPIFFTNNAVSYTINSSDAIGIGGSTSISLLGTGMVTLTGAHTYTGVTTISAGTLQLGDGSSNGHDASLSTSGIVDNSTLTYNVFGSVTPAYPISGSGMLVKAGNGTLTLVSSNAAYTGSTTVSGGTLQLGDGTSGNDPTLATSGIVNNAALVYNVNASQAAGYPISGSGGLAKLGSGVLTLSGSNTYGGNTAVSAGELEATSPASLPGYGTSGKVSVAGGSLLAVQTPAWSSAQIDSLLPSATWASNNSALGIDTAGGDFTYGSNVTQALSLVKLGANTLTLTGVNSYSGTTAVAAGTLSVPNPAGLPGASAGASKVVVLSGASLDVQTGDGTTGWSSSQINSLVGNTAFSVSTSGLGLDTTNGNFSYGSSITPALSLTKLGPNTLTLTAANTYTGRTTISGGTLQLGDGTAGHDGSVAGNIVNNAALVYNLSGNQVYSGQISGNGSLTKTGNGTLTLNNGSSYSGPTVIAAGTLRMQPLPGIPAGSVVAFTFADGATATDMSGNGNNGALNNAPAFVAGPSGPNSYGVSLDGATQWISVPYSSSLANLNAWTASAWVNLSSNAIGQENGLIGTRFNGDNTYDMKLDTANADSSGLTNVHTDVGTGSGWLNIGADAALSSTTNPQAFNLGTWYMVTETVTSAGYNIYVNGVPVPGGSGPVGNAPLFMKPGQTLGIGQDYPKEWFNGSLSDVYIYGRALTPNEVTTLYNSVEEPQASAVNALPAATPVTIAAGAKLDLNGYSQQVLSLSDYTPGSGGSVINSNAAATPILTLAPAGGSSTFSGSIQGAISLAMNGNGTQVLAGSNSYTGGTAVQSGELEAASAASLPGYSTSGAVTVSGGTLAVLAGGATGWTNAQFNSLLANTTFSTSAAALGIDTSNGSLTYGGSINQKLSLTKLGGNALVLTGSNTYPGLTSIGGGTLQLGDGTAGHDGSVAGSILNNSVLAYNLSGNQVYNGVINGSGSVIKAGSGALTLTGANNYGGPTLITAGTLKLSPAPYIPSGALAAYTFADGATATQATDFSGNGNTGALINSPTFVQGPSGPGSYAIALDGSTQSIQVPYNPIFHTNSWTASAWINIANSQTNAIIGTRIGGDTTYDLKINSDNQTLHSDIGTGEGWINTAANATAPQALNTGTWYMVTQTVTSSGFNLYVDGNLVGSGPVGGTIGPPLFMKAGQTLGIGQDYPTEFFNGDMADIYIYGSVLSQSNITALYNSVNSPNSASNALPAGTPVSIAAGAKLDLDGYNQQVASLSDYPPGSGGSVINSNSASLAVLTLSASGGSTTFSGTIQGLINLAMSGNGTQLLAGSISGAASVTVNSGALFLGGSNSYSGGTTVNGGLLEALSTASLPGYSTTGSVTVNGGVLAVQTGGATGWNSAQIDSLRSSVAWSGSGALGIDTSNGNFTYGSNITQNLWLTKLGPNTLTLTGSNTSSGVTTVSGGTLQLGDGTHNGFIAGNILNNSALVYNTNGSAAYAGQISGSGSLTKTGNATLTLSGNSNYSGPTIISSGTVKLAGPPSVAGLSYFEITGDVDSGISTSNTYTHAINPSGGGFSVNGVPFVGVGAGAQPAGSLATATYAQGAGTVTIGNSIDPSDFGDNAIGTNRNGWSGVPTNSGMYQLYSHFDYNTPNPRTVVLTGLQPDTWYNVVLYEKQWDNSVGRQFSIGYDVGNTGAPQFTSPVIDQNQPQNTPVLAALGIGQQTAWGMSYVYETGDGQTSIALDVNSPNIANNYTYHFYGLTNEVLPLAGNNVLSIGTAVTIAAGSTLDLNGATQQVASLSDGAPGSGGSVINSGAGSSVLTLAPIGGSSTFSGSIQGAIGLVMNGPGTQVLAGSNSYTGGTTITQGALDFTTQAALPRSSSGPVNVAGGATLGVGVGSGPNYFNSTDLDNLFSTSGTAEQFVTMAPTSIVGIDTTAANFTYASNIPASGMGLTKFGANTLTLTGSNLYTGLTTISGGTLQLGDGTPGHDGVALAGNIVNNAALVYDLNGSQTYNGVINGSGSVTKAGIGTLALTNPQSYAGTTTINGGTLRLLPGPVAPTVQNASFESPNIGNNNYVYEAPTSWTTGGGANGGAIVNNSSAWGYTIPYPDGNQAFSLQETANITQSVNLQPGSYMITWWQASRQGQDNPYYFQLNGANVGAELSTTNTAWTAVSETFTIPAAGNYTIGFLGTSAADQSVGLDEISLIGLPGNLPTTTALTVAANSTLDLNGFNQQVGSLSDYAPGSGGNIINGNAGLASVLTVSPTGGSTTFSGTIKGGSGLGAISLVLDGPGTLVLAGTDTYTGSTTVALGTLIATSGASLPGGTSLTIGAGGVFDFDPSVAGSPVAGSGAVAAVPEPGTLALLTAGAAIVAIGVWRRRRKG